MGDPVRNRRQPWQLTDAEGDVAVARVEARYAERGADARHIYESLTWGEGPGVLSQMGVQDWLWYRLPMKYLPDEPGYMGRLADVAAELFDELRLDGYAALCRSEATSGVHAAFDRSDEAGLAAMYEAMGASGIRPPDLDDFEWGQVMGIEEASARSAAEAALEEAIAGGELVVGGRGWRARQRAVTAGVLDAEHPAQPGQSWRTAVITERLGIWADDARHRSDTLGRARTTVSKRLLHPIAPPSDIGEALEPVIWLLAEFGEEQALTQAGYLNTTFVRRVYAERPWEDRYSTGKVSRTETDDITLHRLRDLLGTIGAIRKRGRTLKRTAKGAAMVSAPIAVWTALTHKATANPWDRFAIETTSTLLLDRDGSTSAEEIAALVAEVAADMGWQTTDHQGTRAPSQLDVSLAISDTWAMLRLFGMLKEEGDWRNRRWVLNPAGTKTLLAMLRIRATGPRAR